MCKFQRSIQSLSHKLNKPSLKCKRCSQKDRNCKKRHQQLRKSQLRMQHSQMTHQLRTDWQNTGCKFQRSIQSLSHKLNRLIH